jgi:PAS domain-containing protein
LRGPNPTPYGSVVAGERAQRDLILILARDLLSRLATPGFVVDDAGTLAYFNEAAEPVLGLSYAESGELRAGEWASGWKPADAQGQPIPLEELPLGIAFREGRPAHHAMHILGGDGVERDIEVTAFPLKTHADVTVGAIAVFWEREPDMDASR